MGFSEGVFRSLDVCRLVTFRGCGRAIVHPFFLCLCVCVDSAVYLLHQTLSLSLCLYSMIVPLIHLSPGRIRALGTFCCVFFSSSSLSFSPAFQIPLSARHKADSFTSTPEMEPQVQDGGSAGRGEPERLACALSADIFFNSRLRFALMMGCQTLGLVSTPRHRGRTITSAAAFNRQILVSLKKTYCRVEWSVYPISGVDIGAEEH